MNQEESQEKSIRLKLMMCSGSENLYRHPLFKKIGFTDGVTLMVHLCDANWLLTDILANITTLKQKHEFINIELSKKSGNKGCVLTFDDGNGARIIEPIYYKFTDFPLFDWQRPDKVKGTLEAAIRLCFSNDVLYLPSEH